MSAPLRVLTLTEGFFAGGARILHSDVVAGLHERGGQSHGVLAIASRARRESTIQHMAADPRYRALRAAGVAITSLGKTAAAVPHAPHAFSSRQLRTAARAIAGADVVLTLKEQPLGLLLALDDAMMLPDRPVVACLHRSDPGHSGEALVWLGESVRRGIVTASVSCARSTDAAYAPVLGDIERHVVDNGIDLSRFRPAITRGGDPVRRELGIPDDEVVVAYAARFDAMKDPELFLRSVAAHRALVPDAHYILCGAGMTAQNPGFAALVAAVGADRIHALGIRDDMPAVYRAADVVALTSAYGEAAPLCLLEGAASGAIPVTTDVGDAARLVAGIGIVADRHPDAIAAAWCRAIAQRGAFSAAALAARSRLGRDRMISEYAAVVAGQRRRLRLAA
ncbi:glycosyltransferase family 4 protein [Microbacterium sp. cf332]|uniref:glycosyltransferase family 4 protein n=1 Tax=Microbacterium sp. cf332 TaxID=1761804 RepID=UPI00088A08EF|nr:glycosyltransferase family 4 protein [Microbacterium sp. cf332]SDQ89697.1 Glycosyltransferase involved in cell wall bisynthesis [Microbacterium sp. cf332]